MDDSKKISRSPKIKTYAPPSELPILGKVKSNTCSFFGETNHTGTLEDKKIVFGIQDTDRLRHTMIIGGSGTGKSKLLELFIRQDIAHENPTIVFDPTGNLAESLLNSYPPEARGKVIIFDPTDNQRTLALHSLHNVNPELRFNVLHTFMHVCEEFFQREWNPALEHLLRYALIALTSHTQGTLHDLLRLISDEQFRQKIAKLCPDILVQQFWEEEFTIWQKQFYSEAILPLINRFGQFISDPYILPLLQYGGPQLNLGKAIDNNMTVIITLGKQRIHEDNVRLLGGFLMTSIKYAGLERLLKNNAKKNVHFYIDDSFLVSPSLLAHFLTEGKKYGYALTFSLQYLDQLSTATQHTALGNVGTHICFRLLGDDAKRYATEFQPIFESKDFIKLSNREMYLKMIIDDEVTEPFSARTLAVHAIESTPDMETVRQWAWNNANTLFSLRTSRKEK